MRKFAFGYRNSAASGVGLPATASEANRALAVIGVAIVWVSFVFVVFPNLDLMVSRWFVSGKAFVLSENPFLMEVRDISRLAQPWLIGAMIVLIALQRLLPGRLWFSSPHKPLFVLLSFAAGPLLIVHTLKVLIGRVRPSELAEFGGTMDFTPVWQFSAACSRDCSFPSGEASAAAASLSLLVLVPARFRRAAAILLVPCLLLVALNRVVFGAHFLSDVMLGWLLTMFAMAWIWRWMEAYTDAELWS
ncbi:membrane-associated phospholipid phosphatase [Rhizobium sp. BK650]|uniref:phosphatase PAP2 family protein n=1 Tax=Rhizobium sp. BK650 TaxID=2586990 RepID=UPI00161903C0|nr:phosphatase PAP2 family protein [Rhizobium sp. BK650]MBB3656554.1 membrane-associated phospholipid phosphatase [Rhizobium sp. BK650]